MVSRKATDGKRTSRAFTCQFCQSIASQVPAWIAGSRQAGFATAMNCAEQARQKDSVSDSRASPDTAFPAEGGLMVSAHLCAPSATTSAVHVTTAGERRGVPCRPERECSCSGPGLNAGQATQSTKIRQATQHSGTAKQGQVQVLLSLHESKTFWQRCDVCECPARVPYARCIFCGNQPSYHHGRCCPENPGRPGQTEAAARARDPFWLAHHGVCLPTVSCLRIVHLDRSYPVRVFETWIECLCGRGEQRISKRGFYWKAPATTIEGYMWVDDSLLAWQEVLPILVLELQFAAPHRSPLSGWQVSSRIIKGEQDTRLAPIQGRVDAGFPHSPPRDPAAGEEMPRPKGERCLARCEHGFKRCARRKHGAIWQDPQRHLWRGCPEDCEREGYVGSCLPCTPVWTKQSPRVCCYVHGCDWTPVYTCVECPVRMCEDHCHACWFCQAPLDPWCEQHRHACDQQDDEDAGQSLAVPVSRAYGRSAFWVTPARACGGSSTVQVAQFEVCSPSGLRSREARCDLRCQYFYEDSRQCELACFFTLAHHSQLGYMHICEQHYGCVTDDEEDTAVECNPQSSMSVGAALPIGCRGRRLCRQTTSPGIWHYIRSRGQ